MTREAVIDELIENELDALWMNEDYARVALYEGITGYKDYSDGELIEEWENNIGEDTGETLVIEEEKAEVKSN